MPEVPPDVFLLNPKNRPFLEGKGRLDPARRAFRPLWGLCIFAVAGLLLVWMTVKEWRAKLQLAEDGVETSATVLALPVSNDDESTTWSVRYRYLDAGGVEHVSEYAVPKRVHAALAVGGPVTVRYSRSRPEISRPPEAPMQQRLPLALAGLFVLVWYALITLAGVTAWRRAARLRRLERAGRVLEGQIESAREVKGEDTYTLEVVFRFVTPEGNGTVERASANRSDLRGAPLPPPGTKVAVLYASAEGPELL